MEGARNQSFLCNEVELELKDLSSECRKKFPHIKEYTERAILRIRNHRDRLSEQGTGNNDNPNSLEFPLNDVLRAILMACETFQNKMVLTSLGCLQKLIQRRALEDEAIAIVINLMKEQATSGDESVQIKVLQTIMATPAYMTLLNEPVAEQLMQLLYVLHNSMNASVHHTACAGLGQLAEKMADRAAAEVSMMEEEAPATLLEAVKPLIKRHPASVMPTVQPSPAPSSLSCPLRMFYIFVQDLCVMADYDASNLSSRYAVDASERMRVGWREGYWLATIKFPRPLCLELLGTCVATHPEIFTGTSECFALMRHNLCATLLKNLRGCFDFAILIRSIHLLQQLIKSSRLASLLMPEMQVFLHLMLDLTSAERSTWQRATSLEFLLSVCQDPKALAVLYDTSVMPGDAAASVGDSSGGPRTFVELVNSLGKLIHQVLFSSGPDASVLLNCTSTAIGGGANSGVSTGGGQQNASTANQSNPSSSGGPSSGGPGGQRSSINGTDTSRGLQLLGDMSLRHLFSSSLPFGAIGSSTSGATGWSGGARDIFAAGGGAGGDGSGTGAALHSQSSNPTGGASPRQVKSSESRETRDVRGSPRVKLLLMMNETEPPVVSPQFLVMTLIDSVLGIVASLYRLLQEASDNETPRSGRMDNLCKGSRTVALSCEAGEITQKPRGSEAHERCRGMFDECWPSLLSALALLLQGTQDESLLQNVLTGLETLLYCSGRLGLAQARDECMLQISKYATPIASHEIDGSDGVVATTTSLGGLASRNAICFKTMLHFAFHHGQWLGFAGWRIALRSFVSLEKALKKVTQSTQTPENNLKQALDSLFESTTVLPEGAFMDLVAACTYNMRNTTDADDCGILLNRIVEVCGFNLSRLLVIWDGVLAMVMDVCVSEEKGEFRGTAAAALCQILGQALKKGALGVNDQPELSQERILKDLGALLQVHFEDVRARVCEGLLGILQASGQELHAAAWGTMIRLVAMAAGVELERVGFKYALPEDLDPIICSSARGTAKNSMMADSDGGGNEGVISRLRIRSSQISVQPMERHEVSQVLPTIFQLLELLVQDFMEYAPPHAIPSITASIGAFGRFTGLGVNSSLTAVGFLWNVADALARYHHFQDNSPLDGSSVNFEDLWIQIFMHLRVLAVDGRPEVRNCAVKSLTSALLSHGKKVGTTCYQRCLQDILIEVVAEIQLLADDARTRSGKGGVKEKDAGLIVHHSRDTPEKQWNETMALSVEGVRRVLSNFSEEAGVVAFAPLAYAALAQVQVTLFCVSSELSSSALRSLVDLMRIPASSQPFDVAGLGNGRPDLPVINLAGTTSTSIWLLGWSVLWRMVKHCMCRDVPETLMETFEKTLSSLRNTHKHLFDATQHLIVLQVALVLITSPSFYLPSSAPLAEPRTSSDLNLHDRDRFLAVDSAQELRDAVRVCVEGVGTTAPLTSFDREVFQFVSEAPDVLWNVEGRLKHCPGQQRRQYVKAAVPVTTLVDANQNLNADIKSMEFAFRENVSSGEFAEAFLGPGQSPTHRTMLHISSSRMQHVQGFIFGLLEDTRGYVDPRLEILFIVECCATFLGSNTVLLDSNKVALAARTLSLLVLFCRRTSLLHLSGLVRPSADTTKEVAHLKSIMGKAVPYLCKVISGLARARGRPGLRQSGLWKLAIEALVYITEDTLLVIERSTLEQSVVDAYWEAVTAAFFHVVVSSLALSTSHGHRSFGDDADDCDPRGLVMRPEEFADVDLLASVVGNFVVHRLLPCSVAPPELSQKCVQALAALADVQSQRSRVSHAPTRYTNLGHLFDLCCGQPSAAGHEGGAEDIEHPSDLSIVAYSARHAKADLPTGVRRRCALVSPQTSCVLRDVVPALLAIARNSFAFFAVEVSESALSTAPSPSKDRGSCSGALQQTGANSAIGACIADASTDAPTSNAANEVRFILSRLADSPVKKDALDVFSEPSAKRPERVRAACQLAGPQSLVMSLFPHICALVTAPDPRIRRDLRIVLEGLSSEFGFDNLDEEAAV